MDPLRKGELEAIEELLALRTQDAIVPISHDYLTRLFAEVQRHRKREAMERKMRVWNERKAA